MIFGNNGSVYADDRGLNQYGGGFSINKNKNQSNANDFSVVKQMIANRQPYQYAAPDLQSLFSLMYSPYAGGQQGLGNYFGGLLGSNVNSFMGNAGSSGAGRFV